MGGQLRFSKEPLFGERSHHGWQREGNFEFGYRLVENYISGI